MFIFAFFVQKYEFEQSQFQKVGVAPAQFLLFFFLADIRGNILFDELFAKILNIIFFLIFRIFGIF